MDPELGVSRPTKRRPGAAAGGLPVADPRPALDGDTIIGVRCGTCRYPVAQAAVPWCPACYGPVAPARFAAAGAVWSCTVIAIPVGPLRPPFSLAYLDLDDGPRVLVRLARPGAVPIGTRLQVTRAERGDLIAEEEERP